MVSINLIVLIAFYATLAFLIIWKWKKIEKVYHIALMYRTNKATSLIRRISKAAPRFWRVWGYIGIPAVFIGMVWFFVFIIKFVVNLLLHPENAAPGGGLMVPSTSAGIYGPFFMVPITYFLAGVIIAVVLHEFAHAVVSESHGFKIKSAGAGLLAIIPFAFVELDEEKLSKAKPAKQLSIFAAGPFMNFCLAGIFMAIIMFGILPAVNNNGVIISSVDKGGPAELAGFQAGDLVHSINSYTIGSVNDFSKLMAEIKPGSQITFGTERGDIVSSTISAADGSKSVIGVQLIPNLGKLSVVYTLLNWLFLINLGLGLFNALPLGPLDGGRMSKTSFLSIFKRRQKVGAKLVSYISSICLAFVLMLLFGPTLIKLFV